MYKLKVKQSDAQVTEISSQLQMKHNEVVKLQEENEALVRQIQIQKVKFTFITV